MAQGRSGKVSKGSSSAVKPKGKGASSSKGKGSSKSAPLSPQQKAFEQGQAKKQKAQSVAVRRVSTFAEARLERLMEGAGELEARLAELRPFADVVVQAMEEREVAGPSEARPAGRGRAAKKSAARDLLEFHSEVFGLALDLELREEWEESEERLRTWTRSRLEGEGLALFGLSAAPTTGPQALLRDAVVRLFLPGRPMPFHQFSQGDIVLLSKGAEDSGRGGQGGGRRGGPPLDSAARAEAAATRAKERERASRPGWEPMPSFIPGAVAGAEGDGVVGGSVSSGRGRGVTRGQVLPSPLDSDEALEGVVVEYSTRWISVALPLHLATTVRGGGWRMDLYANTVAYERSLTAVQRLARGPSQEEVEAGAKADAQAAPDANSSKDVIGPNFTDLWKLVSGLPPLGTTLEATAAATPNWARGVQGRTRLTDARRVAAALASGRPVPVVGTNGSSGRSTVAGSSSSAGSGGESDSGVSGSDGGNEGSSRTSSRTGGLNRSQASAVHEALGRTLTLWQGPPGTGKTRTLLRLVAAAVAVLPRGRPVLATAASNVAVDNIVAGLVGLGIDVVRVGQPAKVSVALRGVSLEAKVAATPAGKKAGALRRAASGLVGSEAWAAVQSAMALEEEAAQEVLGRAAVIAATCISAGDPRLVGEGRYFPLMVLDEATQASEPASLVPLMSRVESLVLVGDPQQLPPTVKSRDAEQLGLGTSLFVRLQAQGLAPMLLDTQYRMHPLLWDFPSAQFYNARLRSHPKPADRPIPAGLPWPAPEVPVCFIPVTHGREARTSSVQDAAGFSLFNDAEARQVVAAVGRLLRGGDFVGGPSDIGVVTPYNGQVRHLARLFQASSLTRTGAGGGGAAAAAEYVAVSGRSAAQSGGGRFLGGGGRGSQGTPQGSGSSAGSEEAGGRAHLLDWLEIKSVDGFQGREKEVIVFSAVRSNDAGALGFVSDPRRLNVALTRAKRGLVVVGDPNTLKHDRHWRAWLEWAAERGCWLMQPLREGV